LRDLEPRAAAAPGVLWSGTLAFGLVSVPVQLFAATRALPLRARMLAADGAPLVRRYACSGDGQPVAAEEIARGYATAAGEHVIIDDAELDALAPERSRVIHLARFVTATEIPPAHLDRACVMAPAGDGNEAYRLLAAAMQDSGLAGIGAVVMRGREHLVAIFADGGVLRAHTLRFADEVRSPEEVGLPEKPAAPSAATRQFTELIAAHWQHAFDPAELDGDRMAPLRELARRKYEAGEVVVAPRAAAQRPEPSGADGAELIHLLEQRLRAGGEVDTEPGDNSREELYERAKELGIRGRSKMSKSELARANAKN
jgi:DNA end-binding protein Ku